MSEEERARKRLHELVDMLPSDKLADALDFLPDLIPELKAEVVGKIPTEVPEGVEVVKFELHSDVDAESTETVFLAILNKKANFKSAVNIEKMVRTVMYEKGVPTGTIIRIVTMSKEMAWSLQQTIDWAHGKLIEVVAVRREGKVVEVAYIKLGIAPPPPKEKLIYRFQKTDGWTLVGEEKRR